MKRKILFGIMSVIFVLSASVLVSGCFGPKKFTVRFCNENGTEITRLEVLKDEEAVFSYTPTKPTDVYAEYEFDFWADETGANMTTKLQKVNSNLTVYAHFRVTNELAYDVIFYDEDGATVIKSDIIEKGANATFPTNPTKNADEYYSYVFAAWVDKDGAVVTSLINIQATTKLYATYTSSVHTVNVNYYDSDKTTLLKTEKLAAGATLTYAVDKEIDETYSYLHSHWENADGQTVATVENDSNSFNIYAVYSKNIYDSVNKATYTLSEDETYYTLKSCSKETTSLVVPSTLQGIAVKVIGEDIFGTFNNIYADNNKLISVLLPNTIEIIGACAFYECISLSSINLPNSLTTIGDGAFNRCSNLTTMIVPNSVTSLGYGAFCLCEKLSTITLSNQLTVISGELFSGCFSLDSITIPNGVTSIGDMAFYECTDLELINLQQGLKVIGEQAFYGCESIVSITIPSSVTNINFQAFARCSSLDVLVINGTPQIASSAFDGCPLQTIKYETASKAGDSDQYAFKDGVLTIKSVTTNQPIWITHALMKYSSSIVWDSTQTDIPANSFYNMNRLSTITLPQTVTTINAMAFAECDNLVSVNLLGVTTLGNSVFSGCAKLSTVNLPNVTTLGDKVFKDCLSITILNLSKATSISNEIVDGCVGLTTLDLSSLKSIHNKLFSGCTSIKNITISVGTTTEGADAFAGFDDLISITIPQNVTVVADSAFKNCTSVKKVITHNQLTTIGPNAFAGCINLAEIDLSNVVTIGNNAFEGCEALVNINLTNTETVGNYAFKNCLKLTTIENDGEDMVIGDYAFAYCKKLSSVQFDGVVSIGQYAFEYDEDIKTITISNIITIGDYAFYKCTGVESVLISNSDLTIGYACFENCNSLVSFETSASTVVFDGYLFNKCSNLSSIKLNGAVSLKYSTLYGASVETVSLDVTNLQTDADEYTLKNGVLTINSISSDESEEPSWYKNELNQFISSVVFNCEPTYIQASAFKNCELTQIAMPQSVLRIGNDAFYNCKGLTSVDLHNVTNIGHSAFYACSGLESLNATSATTIGTSAFLYCGALKTINLGNVTSIGDNVFSKNLDLVITGTITISDEGVDSFVFKDGVLKINSIVTTSTPKWYDASLNPYITSVVFNCQPTKIPASAFSGCVKLTTITIPNSVETLDDSAFEGCINLVEIIYESSNADDDADTYTLKNGVLTIKSITSTEKPSWYINGVNQMITSVVWDCEPTVIPAYAFSGCSKLSTISIPDSVLTIGDYAFSDSGLNAITLSKVSTIGKFAFKSCQALLTIDLSESIITIENYAFYDCENLTGVTIDNPNVVIKGDHAFYNCQSIKNVAFETAKYNTDIFEFKNGVLTIKSITSTEDPTWYLAGINPLILSVEWECSPTTIPAAAFYMTYGLSSIVIPNSVTTIGEYAFSFSGIQSIDLSKVITVGERAFSDCSRLSTIVIPSTVTKINSFAIVSTPTLKTIVVKAGTNLTSAYRFYKQYLFSGYSFDGWYTTSTFEENSKVTAIPAGAHTSDVTYYAKWVVVS